LIQICSVVSCKKECYSTKDLCRNHYRKLKIYGDPLYVYKFSKEHLENLLKSHTKNEVLPSKSKLNQLYHIEKKSLREISKICHFPESKITNLILEYGIKPKYRDLSKPILISKEKLIQLYSKLSILKIAKMYDTSEVKMKELLIQNGISIQSVGRMGRPAWNKGTKGLMGTAYNKGKKMSKEFRDAVSKGKKGKPSNRKGATQKESTKDLIREKRQHQKNVRESSHEKIMKKLLDNVGVVYQSHKGILRAQPDIFIEPNICIFIDGDYWHFNPNPHIIKNQKRVGYSSNSIGNNGIVAKDKRESDKKITLKLTSANYIVKRYWESDIEKDPKKIFKEIMKLVKKT